MQDLVAPIVPKPDDTAAKIIGSGDIAGSFIKGFAAMAAANARNKELELEGQRMVQAASFHADEVEHQKEALSQADMLARLSLDEKSAYHSGMITNGAAKVLAAQTRAGRDQTLLETRADFNQKLDEYGLTDPNPKNPVDFYAKYQRLRDEFNWTTDPIIKHQLNVIGETTKQHIVPLRYGGIEDSETGQIKFNTAPRLVPVGKVVTQLMDPQQREETARVLQQNGLLTPGDSSTGGSKRTATTVIGDFTVPGTFKDDLRRYLKDGMGVDYSRGVPSYTARPRSGRSNQEANNAATMPTPEGAAPAASTDEAMTGPGVKAATAAPDLGKAAQIKQAFRDGTMSRDDAVAQLTQLGFGE